MKCCFYEHLNQHDADRERCCYTWMSRAAVELRSALRPARATCRTRPEIRVIHTGREEVTERPLHLRYELKPYTCLLRSKVADRTVKEGVINALFSKKKIFAEFFSEFLLQGVKAMVRKAIRVSCRYLPSFLNHRDNSGGCQNLSSPSVERVKSLLYI